MSYRETVGDAGNEYRNKIKLRVDQSRAAKLSRADLSKFASVTDLHRLIALSLGATTIRLLAIFSTAMPI